MKRTAVVTILLALVCVGALLYREAARAQSLDAPAGVTTTQMAAGAIPALYGPSGLISNVKCWVSYPNTTITTTANGSWTANISSAGFANAPAPFGLSAKTGGLTALLSYSPVIDSITNTAVTGHIFGGLTLGVLGATVTLGPSGIPVYLSVCGT